MTGRKAVIAVRVQPNARRDEVVGFAGDALRIRVTAPPEEGRANRALVELLSKGLGVNRSRVTILRGHGSRQKLMAVEGLTLEEVMRRLGDRASRTDQ